MKDMTIGFRTEADLVSCGRDLIRAAIDWLDLDVGVRYEVSAPGGVPDLVIFNNKRQSLQYAITVEFKLSNWQRAINQAFRHRNFVNEAYVVLDHTRSQAALSNLEVFSRANVGFMTIDARRMVRIHRYPEPRLPFSEEFSQMLAHSLLSPYQPLLADLPFIRTIRGGVALSKLRTFWDLPLPEVTIA